MHRYFLYHGVSTHYQTLGWADVRADEAAVQRVTDYLDGRDNFFRNGLGFYLYGDPGTGKTLLGALTLKNYLANGYDGFFTSFVDLIRDHADGFDDKELQRWFTRQIRHAQVLMIDDPGKEAVKYSEKQDSYISSLLDNVLRHRNAMMLPTIITSNDSPEQFGRRYGPGIASLLNESCLTQKVEGPDFRVHQIGRKEKEAKLGLTRPVVWE